MNWPARFYRLLLWCLPAPFRREYGREMEQAFAEELREARTRRAGMGVWWRALWDFGRIAPQEHVHVMKQDLQVAGRGLAARPGFAAVAVLSLALGIGANVALFGLVDALLIRALPVPDPESLVMVTDPAAQGSATGMRSGERDLLTYEEFTQLRDRGGVFASLMAVQSELARWPMRVNGGEPEEIRGRLVSSRYFETLGVAPMLGRTPGAADGERAPVAVLGHEFWQRRFGGRVDALGARLAVKGGSFTVIGVMPPEFFGETVGDRPDVWLPLALQPVMMPGRDLLHDDPAQLQKTVWLQVFGRLKPGGTLAGAQAAANVVFQQGLAEYYASAPTAEAKRAFLNQRLRLRPGAQGASAVRTGFGQPLTLMLAAAGLVLLIACANLGSLMLTRTAGRGREFAVRRALGASRGDLVRQVMTESLVLAVVGGLAGVALAGLLRAGLLALVPRRVWLPEEFGPPALAFAFALTLLTGLLLGLLPALRVLRAEAGPGLFEQGRGTAALTGGRRTGRLLVAVQVALCLPLLAAAGLLIRTLDNLRGADLGFASENLLMVAVDAERAGYAEPRRQPLFDRLHARLRQTPGVRAVAYAKYGMLTGGDSSDEVAVEGYRARGDGDASSRYEHVGPGFFSTLGIPLRVGREIDQRDHAGSPRVCVINEAFARRFFAGRNPLGRRVTQIYGHQRNTYEVVGVVANARKRSLRGEIEHRYYVPTAQPIDVPEGVTFAVRFTGGAAAAEARVRRVIREEDPELPITAARTMEAVLEERTAVERLLVRLSLGFGGMALLLAALGLYGLLAHGVARRTAEIGVRKALGAREAQIVALVLRESGGVVLAGLLAGALLARLGARWIESQLYGLAPSDPLVLSAAVALLAAVGLAAAWVPARRAARVDPAVAIRLE